MYFRLTGASGFFAVVVEEELKSLLKLRDGWREGGKERRHRDSYADTSSSSGVRSQRLTVMGL